MFNQDKTPVNWIRPSVTSNGIELAVSDRTGLVRFNMGTKFRSANLFRDEILALLTVATEIQQYLQDHDDVILSKDANKERSAGKREVQKAASAAAAGLQKLGFTNEQIAEMLSKKQVAG